FGAPRDGADRALEAGRVTDREELLRVRPAAFAAHLGRQAQVNLERPVAGLAVPLGPAPGDVCLGGVDDFAHGPSCVRSGCGTDPTEVRSSVVSHTGT